MQEKPLRIKICANGVKEIVFGGRLQQILGAPRAIRFVALFAGYIADQLRDDEHRVVFAHLADGDFRSDCAEAICSDSLLFHRMDYDFWECISELRGIYFDHHNGEQTSAFDVSYSGRDLTVAPGTFFCAATGESYRLFVGAGQGLWQVVSEALCLKASSLEDSLLEASLIEFGSLVPQNVMD